MTEDRRKGSSTAGSPEEHTKKRREKRYDVLDADQQDIRLQVKNGNGFVPTVLANVSRNGILFKCPVSFSKGLQTECLISVSSLRSREISFVIEVRYCHADNGSHVTGASIVSISDEVWFGVFVEVHALTVLHKGLS